MNEAKCSSCGGDIYWVKLDTGAMHPVNRSPQQRIIVADGDAYRIVAGYRSHFATCPNADQHRKAKG